MTRRTGPAPRGPARRAPHDPVETTIRPRRTARPPCSAQAPEPPAVARTVARRAAPSPTGRPPDGNHTTADHAAPVTDPVVQPLPPRQVIGPPGPQSAPWTHRARGHRRTHAATPSAPQAPRLRSVPHARTVPLATAACPAPAVRGAMPTPGTPPRPTPSRAGDTARSAHRPLTPATRVAAVHPVRRRCRPPLETATPDAEHPRATANLTRPPFPDACSLISAA